MKIGISNQKYFQLVKLIVALVVFNGFIVAILKYFGIILPLSLITIIILFFFPLVVWRMYYSVENNITTREINLPIITISILLFAKLMIFPMELNGSSLSLTLVYIFSLYFFYLTIGLSKDQSMNLIKLISTYGFIILLFGYIQYIFHDSLPNVFTELPRINSSMVKGQYIREVGDLIVFRPNGFIGNPITYGFFILVLLNINLYLYTQEKKIFYIFNVILALVMVILLTSRANITGSFVIILLFLYQTQNKMKMLIYSFIAIVTIPVSIFLLYEKVPFITFVIDRFTAKDKYAQASTEEHIHDYIASINTIMDNPIFGVPIGVYVGENTIITDGVWFANLINYGIVIFIIYLFIWFYMLKKSYNLSIKQKYFGLLFPFFFVITITNFLNSGMNAKQTYVFIWMLLGLIYNLSYQNEKEISNNDISKKA